MATYIQNVQDKVTSVRPPETNWQFEAQLLSTRQAKYDAGHNKLSKMYGQILNAGLTRESDIEAREEFFKLIDSDLKKVAGIDLSLDSNVLQAQHVFSQIYENDFLVKDMVWTKNFQDEMKRADGFKNCVDPKECGGQYWDDGVKFMNYKREEFKNSSNEESMRVGNVRYIPYNNLAAQAMVDMKEAGLDITFEPTPDGSRYKAKMRNGKLLVNPLLALFNNLYAKNPQFKDMYKVMAYNERKDWTYEAVQSGKFNTLDEAAVGFVEDRGAIIKKDFESFSRGIKYDTDALEDKFNALEKDLLNGAQFTKAQKQEYERTGELLEESKNLDDYLDLIKNAQKNQHSQSSMANIGDVLDGVRAASLFNETILSAAKTFANKNSEITYTEDKGWLAQQQHGFDVDMEARRHANDIALLEWKEIHNHSDFSDGKSDYEKMYESMALAENAEGAYDLAKKIGPAFVDKINDLTDYDTANVPDSVNENMNAKEVQTWINDMKNGGAPAGFVAAAQSKLNGLITARDKAGVTMNIKVMQAINKNNDSKALREMINWDLMTKNDMNAFSVEYPALYNNDVPTKALLENQVFYENNKRGRLYESNKTGKYFIIDGANNWHALKKDGDFLNPNDWSEGKDVNDYGYKIYAKNYLDSTEYDYENL